jgi:hypothetical protein
VLTWQVLAGARRANNYNAALVGELKRWNKRLEVQISFLCCPFSIFFLISGIDQQEALLPVQSMLERLQHRETNLKDTQHEPLHMNNYI